MIRFFKSGSESGTFVDYPVSDNVGVNALPNLTKKGLEAILNLA